MAELDMRIIGGIISVFIIIAGASIGWQISKDDTTLTRDGITIATHKWHVEAERTYINKNSWYRTNVMCPKIIANGGYETDTRCYYTPETYEQLSRSLINTKISMENATTASRITPQYRYGTVGSYAGKLYEKWLFVDTDKETEFPKDYNVSWIPQDTRKYKLVWRVWDLIDQPLPDGNYTKCDYYARNVQIKLGEECTKLERAEVQGDRIWFYFTPETGEQILKVDLQDPAAICTTYVDGESTDDTKFLENYDYPDGVNVTVICTGGTSNACIQAYHPDFRDRECDASGTVYKNWTSVRGGETRWNDTRTTKSWVFGAGNTIFGYLKPMSFTAEYIEKSIGMRGSEYSSSWIRDVKIDWNGDDTWDEMYNGELRNDTWYENEFYDTTGTGSTNEVTYDLDFSDSTAESIKLKTTISDTVDSALFKITTTADDDPSEEYADQTRYLLLLDECVAYSTDDELMYIFGGRELDDNLQDAVYSWEVGNTQGYTALSDNIFDTIGYGCSAVYYNDTGDIYVIGGWNGVNAAYNDVRIYDISGDSWTIGNNMSTALAYQACALRPGTDHIYCFGGTNSAGTAQTTSGYWDISAGTWTARTALPSARYSAQVEWYNSTRAIIWGGGANSMGTTEIYDSTANSYSTPASATINLKYVVGAKSGSDIFSYGGQDNTTLAADRKDIYKWDNTNEEWDNTGYDTDEYFSRGHCDEYIDPTTGDNINAYCIGTTDGNTGLDWHLFYHYPEDLSIFLYGQSTSTLTVEGPVLGEQETSDISDEINTATQICPEYSADGLLCYIPVYISAKGGTVTVQNLTQNITHPENYNMTTIEDSDCVTSYCDANKIRVSSSDVGNLTWSNLTLLWNGYQNLEFNGTSDGDGGTYTAGEDSLLIKIYESRATNTFPYTWTDKIIFLPQTNESKNVTPYGWVPGQGLINTTGYKSLKAMSLGIKLNESLPDCVTLYAEQAPALRTETVYCYQESATVDNQTGIDDSCNLNYSGTYSDYVLIGSSGYADLFITYNKPIDVQSAQWKYRIGSNGIKQIDIPTSCFDKYEDTLKLKIRSDPKTSTLKGSAIYCDNGSWVMLDQSTGSAGIYALGNDDYTHAVDGDWDSYVAWDLSGWEETVSSSGDHKIFEEAMNWTFFNILSPSLNTTYQTVTTLSNPSATKYTSFWLSLDCNHSQRFVRVNISREACCVGCKACW